MKKLLAILTLCAAALLVGCSRSGSDYPRFALFDRGIVYSTQDRRKRIRTINKLQLRMAADDGDYFWLYERPTYLNYWYVRKID